MISSITIVNMKGDILAYRDYKSNVRRVDVIQFIDHLLDAKNSYVPPVVLQNGISFLFISQKDIFIIAATKSNENPSLIFEFLQCFLSICRSYFKAELSDPVLRQNYVLIYELLDETMDFGVPQITEPQILQQFIVEGGIDMETLSDVDKLSQLTMQATGANSWRPKPVTYKKNTIYIDMVEKLDILFSQDGEQLRSEVHGRVQVKCELSGNPECTFGLNDKISL